MNKRFSRRLAVFALAGAISVILAIAAIAGGGITVPRLLLAALTFVFGYVVIRLSEAMVASDVERRQHAQRGLILAAMIPALVLTPVTIETRAAEYRWEILVSGLIWLTLIMAYTTFLLSRRGEFR